MKILNQKQLNISLLLLFLACTTNSFGIQWASDLISTTKARLSALWPEPRSVSSPTEEYVNADGTRELRGPVDPAKTFGKAFGDALDTFAPDDSSLTLAILKRTQQRILDEDMHGKTDEFFRCLQSTPRFAYGFRTAHKNRCVKTYDREFTKPVIDTIADATFAIINHKPLVQKLVRIAQANDPSTKTSLSPQAVLAAIKRVTSSGKLSDWQEDLSPELMADLNHETARMVERMKLEHVSWSRCVAKLAPVKPTIGLGNVAEQQCHHLDPLDILEKEFPVAVFAALERELARKKAYAKVAAEAKTETPRDAR